VLVLSHPHIFEILYHGTRGPGKTDTILMDYAQHVGQGYGSEWTGIIFRQTYKQLRDLISKSKRWFPRAFPSARWNNTDKCWTFAGGETLFLQQFNREDDYWNFHGHEYPFIGWDELTNWPDLTGYKRMMSCCRSSNPSVPRKIRATTNPYGPGHNAVKFYFELPAKDGIIRRRAYEFEDPKTGQVVREHLMRVTIKGTIYENQILLKAQPRYIAQIKESARNPAELAAWLEGSWDIVSGGMFDDVWDARYNIVPRFNVPKTWRIDRSFDWGSSAPFSVGWWAESDGSDYVGADGVRRSTVRGDLFRIQEWYGWTGEPNRGLKMLAVDVSKGIIERERALFPGRRIFSGPADTSIFDVVNGVSIALDMASRVRLSSGVVVPGTEWLRADKSSGSRKTGWEMMRKMMSNAQPSAAGREKPGLFVFDNCDQFIRTVPVLPRSDKDPDDIDSTAEDHIADEARYRVRQVGNVVQFGTSVGMY
jgi:hypothetical protein